MTKTLWFEDGKMKLIDQRLLPSELKVVECSTVEEVAEAIRKMTVRGAPAIGCAAAFGMAIAKLTGYDLNKAAELIKSTRPTARNLFWAVERCLAAKDPVAEAQKILEEETEVCRKIGELGSELIPDNSQIITHCNAGRLACPDFGTALSPIYHLVRSGKNLHVYADETRPRLQGARLTCWELKEAKVPFTLITDSMAAYLMSREKIDLVITGADRITANGDVANKIGTYGLAVNAHHHKIPFYVAAPWSTIDLELKTGAEIKIEERNQDEVRLINGAPIAPDCTAWNPAFDVTPASLITKIITEKGIFNPGELKNS